METLRVLLFLEPARDRPPETLFNKLRRLRRWF